MSCFPFYYPQINTLCGTHLPSAYHTKNTIAFEFWVRAFYERMINGLKIEIPWSGDVKDFFNYCLYGYGYVAVFKNETYGLSFQPCTLSGYDFYYRPTNAIITNPIFQANFEIGKECEILKLTPDYVGTFDIIYYYAEKMAELDCALKISIFNEKNPKIYGANTKAQAETLKKIMDKVNQGNAIEIYNNQLFKKDDDSNNDILTLFGNDSKENYMTDKILTDMQTIVNNFDREIGIPTLPYQKKERMVTSEADSTIIDSQSRVLTWYETLKSSIENVKKLIPEFKANVEMRWNLVNSETNTNRNE